MKCDKKYMILYAVTDGKWLSGRTLVHDVEEALKGGITMVQLREKSLSITIFLRKLLK
nr:thiamine phosphate synthase [Lachnotalea glycerini]